MVNRHKQKGKDLMERLESTYLIRKRVSKLDLGIINDSSYFPENSKPDRHYNNGVVHARQDLKLLEFFMVQMKPRYRMKILHSDEFKNFIESVLDIGVTKFNKQTKEENESSRAFALQLMNYSLQVMSKTMPPEFAKLLNNAIEPLDDLLSAIYEYSKNNNVKDLPRFRELRLPNRGIA
ncbi:hypothetical protein NSED_04110 [Candidatus Nitrosopumilus sediminis]|uniref:Uncharacterized protein n=2 Tax=Candidatus Nitrosopumilus sediminis TaxID=1229909 RepID=K0B8V1_9ARCH|nr:hypothetical protein NSED_04110 [Candidatus Nitrosopumilus sediminis]